LSIAKIEFFEKIVKFLTSFFEIDKNLFLLYNYNQEKKRNKAYNKLKGLIMNKKVYESVMSGKSDNNIKYTDFQNLIIDLGFEFKRQKGSHEMYYHHSIREFMNIQKKANRAKDYQVKQLREIIIEHNL